MTSPNEENGMRNLILCTTATCAILLVTHDAQAARPPNASGDFAVESIVVTSAEQFEDYSLLKLTAVFGLEGTFDGPMTSDFEILHFGALDEPAPELFFAVGTFDGSVNGAAGTLDYVFFGVIDAAGNAEGDLVILSGSGELTNLRGQITLQGVTGVGGHYAGRIR